MDRMLKRATRRNKRRGQRNSGAWRSFSPDGETCRYCKHDGSKHLCQSGQPHFYRPATEAEKRDPSVMLYRTPCPRAAPCWCGGWSSPTTPSSSPPSAQPAPRASGLTKSSATSATWASARWWGCRPKRTSPSPPDAAHEHQTRHERRSHMRLAAQAKGGFYPTPPRVVDLIAELVHTPSGSYNRGRETLRILDPCCGAGEALAQLAQGWTGPTPSPSRPTASSCTGTGRRRPRSGWTTPWPRTCSPRP